MQTLIMVLVRGNGQGVCTDPRTLVFYWLITASMFLSRGEKG